MKDLIISIDGYSSSGKSTYARKLAHRLNYLHIDSGAMYRGVTLYILQHQLIREGKIAIEELIRELPRIQLNFKHVPGREPVLFMNGKNISREIRENDVSDWVSEVSAIPEVREYLVKQQRAIGKDKRVVMEGRDIGSVVFPDADLKIFLVADPDIRARRRYKEFLEKGYQADYEEVRKNLLKRDRIDSTREVSPLIKPEDALVLDNSHMTPDEQVEWTLGVIREKYGDD